MNFYQCNKEHPKVGVLLGDHAGIGPEITAKMFHKLGGSLECIPVVIASYPIFLKEMELFAPEQIQNIRLISDPDEAEWDSKTIYFIDLPGFRSEDIPAGEITSEAGRLMVRAFEVSLDYAVKKKIDGILLCPLRKESMVLYNPQYPSEFPLFDDMLGVQRMGCVKRAGPRYYDCIVGHVPLREVPDKITEEAIRHSVVQMHDSMKKFGIEHPRIGISALNPHAGQGGDIGDDEIKVITPAIQKLCMEGYDVYGPYPADTMTISAERENLYGLIYMFHDQLLVCLKSAHMDDNIAYFVHPHINFPMASMGHGCAPDIAGKGIANEANMCFCIVDFTDVLKGK
ncbi:PdxA family dehydrogenase [Youxingia wuxianensis]|uniref:4-hydroxythreonine-4-phosphate dehydrogenase PdxA n=1 Tax=Youxingia wuxianensis TaxID=2763678 RepID=A0A926II48_9FIRM|nr:4-hydroxythreonine-4-phosphate dehydrogenase PdxA [Youxingia wuxianensis]MBC8585825.1 4-hydroxythreonine-4-phosphate dehydrogenase PdxA [Youxingia wuxianensis]